MVAEISRFARSRLPNFSSCLIFERNFHSLQSFRKTLPHLKRPTIALVALPVGLLALARAIMRRLAVGAHRGSDSPALRAIMNFHAERLTGVVAT